MFRTRYLSYSLHEHTWEDYQIAPESCIVYGFSGYRCSICHLLNGEEIAGNHQYGELSKDDNGHWNSCLICGETTDTEVHLFENACDAQCDTCGYRREVTHSYQTDWVIEESGHWHECTICGEIDEIVSHSSTGDNVATCMEKAVCDVCGSQYGIIPGHAIVSHTAQAPTCTENGWDEYETCSNCDYTTYVELEALGHTFVEGICSRCGAASGYCLSGIVTSFGTDDVIMIELVQEGVTVYSVEVTGKEVAYTFDSVAPGTYTMVVSKQNHVSREYTVTVADTDLVQDVRICLIGDITGDGRVNMKDWGALYDHINEKVALVDYTFLCADVTGDGKVNMKDWNRLYDHINEVNPLW